MRGSRVINIFLKYFLIFIGLTIFLFIIFKFVPEYIIINDFPGSTIEILGLHENYLFQYFDFVHALLTGNTGYVAIPFYSGTVKNVVSLLLPETILFLVMTFISSYIISYIIGFYSGTAFKTAKRLDMNIFPLFFLYLISGLTLLTVFSGILGWLPFNYILSGGSLILNNWISYTGKGLFITSPTNIIMIDSIIHHSPGVLFDYLKHTALPFIALIIPTTMYLSTYISHETSIEYNKGYMKAGITRDAFRDNYILYIKRGIRSRMLEELKPVFLIFVGGMIMISYIFSYMNLGEFAVYSFLNYDFGIMGGLYAFYIFSIIIIIFDFIIDVINVEAKHED
jgi:peptide/nickel transport system permease protein